MGRVKPTKIHSDFVRQHNPVRLVGNLLGDRCYKLCVKIIDIFSSPASLIEMFRLGAMISWAGGPSFRCLDLNPHDKVGAPSFGMSALFLFALRAKGGHVRPIVSRVRARQIGNCGNCSSATTPTTSTDPRFTDSSLIVRWLPFGLMGLRIQDRAALRNVQ